ncbi:MAG: CheR family methyltransferase [Cyanobacteria bacterium P01_E01_bin.42]
MNRDDRSACYAIETLLSQKIGLNADSLGEKVLTQIILREMKVLGFANIDTYWQYLSSSAAALERLVEASVVPETSFFRNPDSFDYLRRYILAQHDRRSWRILSVPCSTGEEPYSIAMTLLQVGLPPQSFQIDGVDISTIALAKADRGIYDCSSFRKSAARWANNVRQYFQGDGRYYCMGKEARSQIRFYRGNLADVRGLRTCLPYDIIFCRNLLIYLNDSARDRALNNLYRLLLPDGLLLVGHAETRQIDTQRFSPVRVPHTFAYRRRSHPIPRACSPPLSSLPAPLPSVEIPASQPAPTLAEIRALADRGSLLDAWEQCDRYLQEHPTDGGAYLLLGVIYQARGEDNLAELAFQKALFLDPHCEETLVHLLLLSQQKGNLSAVRRLQQRLARLEMG